MQKTDHRFIFRPLVGGALALALVHGVLLRSMPLISDAMDYHLLALDVVSGKQWSSAFYMPPGIPLLLASLYGLLGPHLWVARGIIIVLQLLTIPLAGLLTFELLGQNERAGRWTAWIAALYPPAVMLAGQPYSQHLTTVCLLATAYFWLKGLREERLGPFFPAGAALGIGILARPSMLSLCPVLGLAALCTAWSRRDPTKRGLGRFKLRFVVNPTIAFMLAAGTVLPVMLHSLSTGAGWAISTNNERNFFLGNNRYTPIYKTGHFAMRGHRDLEPEVRDYLIRITHAEDKKQLMMREALGHIRNHPFLTLLRTANRLRAFWGFDYLASRQIQQHKGWGVAGLGVLLAIEAGGYILLMLAAIAGVADCLRSRNRMPVVGVLALVFAYQLPYALAHAAGTYHFPVVYLLIPFAVVTFLQLAAKQTRATFLTATVRAPATWVAIIVFLALQAEYLYFTARHAG